jgi:hypothetical protein
MFGDIREVWTSFLILVLPVAEVLSVNTLVATDLPVARVMVLLISSTISRTPSENIPIQRNKNRTFLKGWGGVKGIRVWYHRRHLSHF